MIFLYPKILNIKKKNNIIKIEKNILYISYFKLIDLINFFSSIIFLIQILINLILFFFYFFNLK